MAADFTRFYRRGSPADNRRFVEKRHCILPCRRQAMFATHSPLHIESSVAPTTLEPAIVQQRAVELMTRDRWTRSQLVAHQERKLRDVLRHAVKASPYYRETIGHLVARQAPLKDFPILTKKDLVANFDRIVTDRRLRLTDVEQHLAGERAGDLMFGQYRACATGGTSGVRAVIVYDQTAWENAAANAVRYFRATGVTAETRLIGIGAPTPQHFSCRLYEEMRLGRSAMPRLHVTTPLPEIVAALNDFQPDTIATYPSFIRRLAEEQMEGRLKVSVKRFCSSAEALMPDVRDLALRVWGATISNRFAATEMGMAGSECEHFSGIHLPEDLVAFEAVDESYRKVPSGVSGSRLLITTLTNSVL